MAFCKYENQKLKNLRKIKNDFSYLFNVNVYFELNEIERFG